MKHTMMTTGFGRLVRLTAIAALVLPLMPVMLAGCTMKKQDAPDLTGPSEFATSLTVSASPDVITQDGSSQSVVAVVARDVNGSPMSGVPLRVDISVNGRLTPDFGRLSATNLVTGSDGRAVTVYTAPLPPPDLNDPEPIVDVLATVIGNNFDNSLTRSASIRLARPAVTYVPGAPFAEFTYSPATPRAGSQVHFDGRLSYDPDGSIVLYQWDYGDGDREQGETQQHDFVNAGTYHVTLTVTDNSGLSSSRTRIITVVE